jgi:hypothetical protein
LVSTMAATCASTLHTFVLNPIITNQEHRSTWTYLGRMMAVWVNHYVASKPCKSFLSRRSSCLNIILVFGESIVHIPDITTQEGLLDVIMVGNMLEFASAFSFKYFGSKPPADVIEERNVAMWRYRLFQGWFNRRYILDIGGAGLNPCYLFNRSLLQFGAAICCYMRRWEKKVFLGITAKQVTGIVLDHIRNEWQDLLVAFEKTLKDDSTKSNWFTWKGPTFRIFRRDESQVWTEMLDWPEDPVYTAISGTEDDEDVGRLRDDHSDPETHSTRSKRPHPQQQGKCISKTQR